jgi:hypothetical protein
MTRRVLLLLVMVAAVAAVVLWLLRAYRRPVLLPTSAPVRERAATPRPPLPVVSPTPAPEPPVTRHTTVVVPWDTEPTLSPTEPEPTDTPTPRPEPSATPGIPECVAIRWSAEMSPANIAQVLVEIHAENRCGRDLDPLEVWFEIAGYRQGDLVQSVRGHLFDPLPKDGDGKALIALPGSADWYDEIRVAVLPATDP